MKFVRIMAISFSYPRSANGSTISFSSRAALYIACANI